MKTSRNFKKILIKMIRIGVIGANSGNGHPISYSSIFNGFDKYYFKKYCEFEIINNYLPKQHKNLKKNIINGAKVTHIWTQDLSLSYKISKICKIPNICKTLNEMANNIDAAMPARDDIENHYSILKIFIQKSIPIFIDKLIVDNIKEWRKFKKISKTKYICLLHLRDLQKN